MTAALSKEMLVAGAGVRARPLPSPVVLHVHTTPAFSLTSRCILMEWVLHPALVNWMSTAGWKAGSNGVLTSKGQAQPAAALDLCFPGWGTRKPVRKNSAKPGVHATSRTIQVFGPSLPDLVTFTEAFKFLSSFRSAPVLGSAAYLDLVSRAAVTVTAFTPQEYPSKVMCGPVGESVLMPPVAAFSMLEREHLLGPVEADTLSVDLVEMSLAVGIGRPGLTALQDLAVSQMLATETGAMLAHPPGSGKTVIAVAALAESVSRRILVVVPKATLPQWQAELNTWAPGLPVRIPHSSAELGRATSSRGVTLTTLDMASSWALDASTDGHWDELIVDEAAALVKSSTRTRGLWVLREHATRAFALTGTPGEAHGSVDTADIVAWCRNLPRSVVRPVPDADFQPVLLLPRFDPDLPTLNVNIVKCTPSSADARWLQELGLMRENALTPFDRSRVKELVRRGLGDPLGAGSQASWSKRDLILKVLADHARERGSALLFATSIPAASEIVRLLQLEGIPAGVLSGELSRQARAQMLASFASGETSVLAVTPSAQRGVNLEMASLVVHQDMPVSRSIFDQRNARAARMNSTHRVIRVVIPVLEGTWDERWSQAVLTSTFGEVNPLDYA